MALFPAWNGSQGARPPASSAYGILFHCHQEKASGRRQGTECRRDHRVLNHSRFPDAMLLPFCPLNRRGPLAGRFGPSAQQPTGQALPSAPVGVGGCVPKPYAAAFFANIASACRAQETRLSPKAWVFQRSGVPVARDGPGLGALWQSSKHMLLFLIPLGVRLTRHRWLAR